MKYVWVCGSNGQVLFDISIDNNNYKQLLQHRSAAKVVERQNFGKAVVWLGRHGKMMPSVDARRTTVAQPAAEGKVKPITITTTASLSQFCVCVVSIIA